MQFTPIGQSSDVFSFGDGVGICVESRLLVDRCVVLSSCFEKKRITRENASARWTRDDRRRFLDRACQQNKEAAGGQPLRNKLYRYVHTGTEEDRRDPPAQPDVTTGR